jgi:hypothetical protein
MLWTIELLVSIQELTKAMTTTVETLPAMITTGAATTGVMTIGTIIVKDNNMVTNENAMMAITISVMTSTTVTYVLALNRELGTVHPMKPVVAWSTIRSMVPRAPTNSPTTYDRSSGLEVLSLKC